MKRCVLFAFLYLLTAALPAFSQGALLPAIPPSFLNASGLVASGGKLCTTATGGNTSLATYSDSALTSALLNPITLNALGIPQTSGGASTAIYILPREYRITLYAAGTGNTCNGVAVGAQIWQRDHVFDIAQLPTFDNVVLCNRQNGTTADVKINACISALPSTGGTADARGIIGAQNIAATITDGSKKVLLLLSPSATFSCSATTQCFNLQTSGTILDCNNAQITATADTHGIGPATGTTARNCHFTGRNVSATASSGINSGNATGVTIENNIFDLWGNYALNSGGSSNYWIVRGNTFKNSIQGGVFYPSSHGIIEDNVITGNGSNGVDLNGSYNQVRGNQVVGNGTGHVGSTDSWGILIAAAASDSNYNIIEGNTVTASVGQGIIIKPTTTFNTSYNVITGNTVTGATNASNGDGITIDGTSGGAARGNIVSHNIVAGNARHGILVDGTSATVTGNTVSVNYLTGNTGTGLLITGGATSNALADNISLSNGTNINDLGTYTIKSGNIVTTAPGWWIDSAADGVDGFYLGNRTNGWAFTERVDASLAVRITASGAVTGTDRLNLTSGGTLAVVGALEAAGATPTAASGYVAIGSTNAVGSGTSGTTVTTVTKGGGSGPTTAQTVTNYLKINISGTDYWIPLMQFVAILPTGWRRRRRDDQ